MERKPGLNYSAYRTDYGVSRIRMMEENGLKTRMKLGRGNNKC